MSHSAQTQSQPGGRIRAIGFDFDGVILDSARAKTELFVRLYEGSGEAAKIREYCDVYGGVPRRDKLVHIETQILKHPLDNARVDTLCAAFTRQVGETMRLAPWIAGAKEFIEAYHRDYIFFIVSGSPQDELTPICEARGLTPYFRGIAGSPPSKKEWVSRYLNEFQLSPQETVFVGDSLPDWQTAQASGLRFIGIGKAGGWLPAGIPIIPDLCSLAATLKACNPL